MCQRIPTCLLAVSLTFLWVFLSVLLSVFTLLLRSHLKCSQQPLQPPNMGGDNEPELAVVTKKTVHKEGKIIA